MAALMEQKKYVYNLFNAVIVAKSLQTTETSTSTKEYCSIYFRNVLYCGKTCCCVSYKWTSGWQLHWARKLPEYI